MIELRNGIKCNQASYFAAISQKKTQCLHQPIIHGYLRKGQLNLAERCRRQQADTGDKLALDDKTTTVINEEFYNYLRTKRFTLPQIEDQLSKLPHYHHCAVTSVSSSKKYRNNKNKKPLVGEVDLEQNIDNNEQND